jgi:uncharacterized membrane protein
MASTMIQRKPFNFLIAVLFLQFMVYLTIFFNVPVARQIIGFAYLTFVPGFVFVKLLRLDRVGLVVSLLFSVGFSLAFLMFSGLLINESFSLANIPRPLSLMPLLIIISSLTLLGGVIVFLRGDHVSASESETLSMPPPSVFLFLALPVLSIVGAMLVNSYANNVVLLFTIISIALLFSIGVLSKKFLPPKYYPVAVLMSALAILFQSSLISPYIVSFGSDIPGEFLAFSTTKINAYWSPTNPFIGSLNLGRFNSMLSITILPTIYSTLLNLDPTWMFKLLTPFLFSLVPLTLYYVWKQQIGAKYAFISTFLLMAQLTFYTEMLGLNRQMIAELFFALLLLILFNNKMKNSDKVICFMVFGAALIVSHYSLAEIFLLFAFVSMLASIFWKSSSRKVTVGLVVLFSVVMFAWYIYTSSGSTFNSFITFGTYVQSQFSSFFSISSRGNTVLAGLGLETAPSIWATISRATAYVTEALIAVGFIGLAWQKLKKHQFGDQYFVFIATAAVFLVALIAVPGLANTLDATRFYHILLFLLAPLCILGGATIIKIVSKRERIFWVSILLLLVLVPYFLFQTGFVYEITKSESTSVSLSKDRMSPVDLYATVGYTDAYSVFGAQWLARNVNSNQPMYADGSSIGNVLLTYGLTYNINILSNVTTIETGGVIYLNTLNVEYGTIVGNVAIWNSTALSSIFNGSNLVYDNGNSLVYQHSG